MQRPETNTTMLTLLKKINLTRRTATQNQVHRSAEEHLEHTRSTKTSQQKEPCPEKC